MIWDILVKLKRWSAESGGQHGHSCAILKDDAAADRAGQTPGREEKFGLWWKLVRGGEIQ